MVQTSPMTCSNQSECFTSAYQNYAFLTFLKFLYNIGSRNKVFSFEWQIDPFIARYLPIITYSTMVKYCTARSIGLFHVSMQTWHLALNTGMLCHACAMSLDLGDDKLSIWPKHNFYCFSRFYLLYLIYVVYLFWL